MLMSFSITFGGQFSLVPTLLSHQLKIFTTGVILASSLIAGLDEAKFGQHLSTQVQLKYTSVQCFIKHISCDHLKLYIQYLYQLHLSQVLFLHKAITYFLILVHSNHYIVRAQINGRYKK